MKNSLIYFLWIIAGVFFIVGILYAAYYTLWVQKAPQPESMPDFLTWTVTIIGSVLATNFGAVLGISMSTESNKFAGIAMFNPLKSRSTFNNIGLSLTKIEKMQVVAAYVYFLGMILSTIFFAINGFTDNPAETVIILPELSKTLIGACVGALAVSGSST